MVTFAQAQERADEWINGDVPAYQHREVRVREFELGFVVWAEDRDGGPSSDGGRQRLVIARDSGEATLWPGLPVGEVIRRYEEEYGVPDEPEDAVPAPPPARIDLNQTSFLLTPPEWLQEAADRMGIPDRSAAAPAREETAPAPARQSAQTPAPAPAWPATPAAAGDETPAPGWPGATGPGAGEAAPAPAPAWPGATPAPASASASSGAVAWPTPTADAPSGATPWAGTDTNAGSDEGSVPLPATVFAPPLSGSDADDTPPPRALPEAKTALLQGGSQLPPTALAPAIDPEAPAPGGPGGPGGAGVPAAPGGPEGAGGPGAPGPGAPGAPAGHGVPGPGAPGGPAAPVGPGGPGVPGGPGAAGGPGMPPGPGVPGNPVGHGGPGVPLGPGAPGNPVGHGVPGVPSGPGAPGGPVVPAGPGGPGAPGAAGGPGPVGQGASGVPGGPGAAGGPGVPPGPGAPGNPVGHGVPGSAGSGVSGAADIADAATSKAAPPRAARGSTPAPPGEPGVPGARPGVPAYVPTQLVSQLGPDGPQPPVAPSPPGGGVHHAATMLADPSQLGPAPAGAPAPPGPPGAPGAGRAPQPPGPPGVPGAPQPPGPPGAPGAPGAPQPPGPPGAPGGTGGGGAHYAATMLADPSQLGPGGRPGAPQPPGPPGAPGQPGAPAAPAPPGAPGGGVHHAATMLAGPAQMGPGAPQPPAYGYPQQPTGVPTVGPGYQAVLRYRAADGSEQQLIRRSAPGIPHPEWQIFHELRGMNVPPDHVLELHTELASCELPGGYCARMIRETWPQVRITSVAPYGTDHASRRQGVQHLLTHQGELAQVADGPARPQPVRAPLPQVQPAPPLPPEGVAHELAGAFGPQGVFRFDQRAVSRQGVPEAVAVTLVWAGLPADFGPFFWAQAVPGQPVPTLAELAAQRQVQAAPDAGSYLVMGSDFGRAICVQYGTANIVAVPVEAGPGGQSVPPQFVNTGLPEFVRCMALLGRMWRLRYGLNPEQAGRWTVDFQAQLAALDPAALGSPESWWSVLLEQFWDGLL
ncbi:SUKH-4 family immunity protein [Streptomyces crystallinus]|uniref:Nucleic acid/nucleotide deaminase of polymorphic system toxin n=1 Tax=Streptomyces crystallinus TaxID=68191 RepID=A0ABN1FIB2_9ACTN